MSLYMDLFQITCCQSDKRTVEIKLQDSKNIVEKFAQKNDVKFSTTKTSMFYFTKLLSPPPTEF